MNVLGLNFTLQGYDAVIAFLIPVLVAFLTDLDTPDWVKGVLATIFCALAATFRLAFTGELNENSWAVLGVLIMAVASASYSLLVKHFSPFLNSLPPFNRRWWAGAANAFIWTRHALKMDRITAALNQVDTIYQQQIAAAIPTPAPEPPKPLPIIPANRPPYNFDKDFNPNPNPNPDAAAAAADKDSPNPKLE